MTPGTRLHRGPQASLLVGGSPTRVLALAPAAGSAVARWRAGSTPVGPGERRLAMRLHDLGVLTLRQPSQHLTADVTVVVPARDRVTPLARCLASIGPCGRVLVVDDSSADRDSVRSVAERHGAAVVRRVDNGGPAAARNTGLDQVETELVAFVDSDCVLPPNWLAGLLGCFLDERTALVAPRVIGAGAGLLARFEACSGPLDLGRVAGPVSVGARVGYLPAAVVVARKAALTDGFDESLRVGEDVDLVWRLVEAGWLVRYEPAVVVGHATRGTAGQWLTQRYGYGTSAAGLDRRHPGALSPARVGPAMLPVLAAAAAGQLDLAFALAGAVALALRGRLPAGPGRDLEALRLTTTGLCLTIAGLAEAALRVWSPALLPACLVSRRVRTLLGLATALRLARAHRRERPTLGLVPWAALRLADDAAYATGVWVGAVGGRRPQVLLPRLGSFTAAGEVRRSGV